MTKPHAIAAPIWNTLGHLNPMPEPQTSGTLQVGGAEIYYAVYGTGDPLVLLHGGLGNTQSWANQIPDFSKNYRVVTIDSRGHGRSTRDKTVYTIDLLSADVLAVMDHLNIGRAKFVGWSDGANISINIAMKYPQRAEKVFAFGANYNVAGARDDYEDNPNVAAFISKAQSDYELLSKTPDQFENFVAALMSGMWEHEPNVSPKQLGALTVPIAIAFGVHDEFIRLEHAKDMAALMPNSKLILFENASHFALWQVPDKFTQTALDYLQQ